MKRWLVAGGTAVALLCVGFASGRAPTLEGRYESIGVHVLADGSRLTSYHSILFVDDRFYAMTRLGDTQVETSGKVRTRFSQRYFLDIQKSQTQGPLDGLDDSLRFNLLYSRNEGSVLELKPSAGCLYSLQTQQLYCKNIN